MEIIISRANLDDIDGLIHVYKNDGAEHVRGLDNYPLTEFILDQNHHFLVARISRKPIGFIFARKKGEEIKIDMFSVLKKYRNKGVEKKLLDEVEGIEDASKITTYVPKSDKWIVALFKKHGFMVYNEVKNLFGDGEVGLYLIKDLTELQFEKPRKKRTRAEKAAKSFLEENLGKLDVYLEP